MAADMMVPNLLIASYHARKELGCIVETQDNWIESQMHSLRESRVKVSPEGKIVKSICVMDWKLVVSL